MDVKFLMESVTYVLMAIGVTAFIVSIITQAIKEMPLLKKIPTNVVVLVLSLILCPVEVIVLCQYFAIVIEWYYIFASFIASFIVYLVSTGGWERVTDLWKKTKYKNELED
jgi:putative effector of murein hydrolase LrgA (UPF0299 family)